MTSIVNTVVLRVSTIVSRLAAYTVLSPILRMQIKGIVLHYNGWLLTNEPACSHAANENWAWWIAIISSCLIFKSASWRSLCSMFDTIFVLPHIYDNFQSLQNTLSASLNILFINVTTKKRVYISLVRSQLLYRSQIWRPQQLKDMKPIESQQCHATKYILSDYTLDYRSRLIKFHLL